MPEFIVPMLGILLSMVILTVSSSFFGKYIVMIAQYLKVRDVIVATLLLGLVGSLGEVSLGVTALIIGYQNLILGLVIGVSIGMILLVGGISIIYNKGIPVKSETHAKIMPILNVAVLAFVLLVSDGQLSQSDGLILILIFFFYIIQVIRIKDRLQVKAFKALSGKKELIIAIVTVILILINIGLTAGFAMQNAYDMERVTEISLFIMGLTLFAPFSIVPELIFELELSRNGTSKTALSDLVTSCVANLTFVIGLVALISPFTITAGNLLNFNLFALALVFVVFNIYVLTGRKLDKKEGIVMVCMFFIYLLTNYLLIAV